MCDIYMACVEALSEDDCVWMPGTDASGIFHENAWWLVRGGIHGHPTLLGKMAGHAYFNLRIANEKRDQWSVLKRIDRVPETLPVPLPIPMLHRP